MNVGQMLTLNYRWLAERLAGKAAKLGVITFEDAEAEETLNKLHDFLFRKHALLDRAI